MDIETIIAILVGTGGIGAIISAFFDRKNSKEKNELDLLDRAQIQIESLNVRIEGLEKRLDKQRESNKVLERKIQSLKDAREKLRREIWELENKGE